MVAVGVVVPVLLAVDGAVCVTVGLFWLTSPLGVPGSAEGELLDAVDGLGVVDAGRVAPDDEAVWLPWLEVPLPVPGSVPGSVVAVVAVCVWAGVAVVGTVCAVVEPFWALSPLGVPGSVEGMLLDAVDGLGCVEAGSVATDERV